MGSSIHARGRRTATLALQAGLVVTALGGCGGGSAGIGTSLIQPDSANGALAAQVLRTPEVDTTSCLKAPAVPALPSGGLIDVTDFGATADDDTDDTVAIQRAINSARKGQWVYFPPGRYLHNKSLSVLQPGITLWGQGATLHATNPADQAIMLKADAGRVYGFTLTAVTEGRRTEPWTSRIAAFGLENPKGYISGIVVQNNRIVPANEAAGTALSNATSTAGVLMLAARDFTVAGNTVRRSLADGIHITGGSTNGRVVGNQVSQTGDDMIAMVSYLAKDWQQLMAAQPTWYSQHVDSTLVRNVWVSGNTVSDAYWGRGISVVGGADITVAQNSISRVGMAAGVLVAREEGYFTHGVNNVRVDGNQITDIQTLSPTYVPTGSAFAGLQANLANNGGRTSHGAIEVHNLSSLADLSTPVQQGVLGVSGVLLRNNTVQRAYRDGVRLGAGSALQGLTRVALVQNDVSDANHQAFENRLADDSALELACSGNRQQGADASARGCSASATVPDVTGARLLCSAFPAP